MIESPSDSDRKNDFKTDDCDDDTGDGDAAPLVYTALCSNGAEKLIPCVNFYGCCMNTAFGETYAANM